MSISREVLSKYVTAGCVFIETGTRRGDTAIKAYELGASQVWTYEIDPEMAATAQSHIEDALRGNHDNVQVIVGDSATLLGHGFPGDLTKFVDIVVYLDAHTGTHSPVLDELKAIGQRWPVRPHVILIDDMRCMEGWRISHGFIYEAIVGIGDYKMSLEDGVEPKDILAAVKQ